ncbi:hypothetical protein SAMN05428989_3570 [Pseudoxanthomonas sp. GM95]|uniref:hypothetical protein n=1 Tax=Pseudoxanthomonas sp. GM95 TaxID=1881043 RepID=UPI0008C2B99B|nr:hypothetical protein [Pseudoxanthomonas sp. GM95]SEM26901.1 hypothetical protein SAMN05428989_3570 [Pseudoxanthomonas sp. GM95]
MIASLSLEPWRMDLIRLLRSLEEFLYELVGWLVFYPRTFWKILRHPGQMARYTREELLKPQDSRFQATISPVLMLILTVGLAHAIELVTRQALPNSSSPVAPLLFGSDERLMLTRSAIFCVFALGASLGTLRRQRIAVTRETLREPFSIQAFLVCPFVLALAVGEALVRSHEVRWHMAGIVLCCTSVGWYLAARTDAFRTLNAAGLFRAFWLVLASFLLTTAAILAVVAVLLV